MRLLVILAMITLIITLILSVVGMVQFVVEMKGRYSRSFWSTAPTLIVGTSVRGLHVSR